MFTPYNLVRAASLPAAVSSAILAATACALLLTAVSAHGQTQSAAQQACSTGLDKSFAKSVSAVGKEICACVKDIAKGKTSSASCFGKDRKGKIAKSLAKVTGGYADDCLGNLPDFGSAGAGAASVVAQATGAALLDILFGDDLDAALPIGAPDQAVSKCQQSVAKALKKCQDKKLKEYTGCKKKALKAGAADAATVEACFGADDKGKIAKACDLLDGSKTDKVRRAIAKSCVAAGADLVAAFPRCATSDPEQLHACLDRPADCLACQAVADVGAFALTLDCDTFDNGAVDGSCAAVKPQNSTLASPAEPAETPGTSGVVVTNPKLITQFGGASVNLNDTAYTRWRLAGPERTPDAILILVAGFGGGANNFKMMAEDLIAKALADHGLVLEVWGIVRRTEVLEDRAGSLAALAAGDPQPALDWFFGDALGLTLGPVLTAGPNRRAVFYNNSDDIPFIANWTGQVFSRDIDVVVEEARTLATNANVFLGGHSAGTGFTARYAATDFNLSGVGPADPGHGKLRGLVMLEGGAGSTGGDPLSGDTLDRIEAKFDGGLFGAVRDAAPRCVDGTTPCTIGTEAVDCLGQVPPVCTEPTTAYAGAGGIGPEIAAASEPLAIQAITDSDSGLALVQVDQSGPGTAAVDVVPQLNLLGFLPGSTVEGLFGAFLDDDGLGASLSAALATGLGAEGGGIPKNWLDITEPLPASALPDNGPMPTTLPAAVWGQEKELVLMSRFLTTFLAADSNAADWYFASSGLSVTSAPGVCSSGTCSKGNVGASCSTNAGCAQSISLDSTALSIGRGRTDIANLTQAPSIDIPVICFGGSNGLTPVGASYLPFASSIGTCTAPSCNGTPRVVNAAVPSEAFPTFGDIDGGYEVHIREGLAHNDVIAAEDGPDSDVLGPLAAFIARNLQ